MYHGDSLNAVLVPSPRYQERLASADSDRLCRWSERILTAETIDDVFSP